MPPRFCSIARGSLPLLAMLAACNMGDSVAATGVATAITTATPPPPTAPVATALPQAPTFLVTDGNGRALAGLPVSVTVASGGGTIDAPAVVTNNGPTAVGTWTLGPTAGLNTLRVQVAGVPPLVLTARGLPGEAAVLTVLTGADQSAPAVTPLSTPITVRVWDAHHNAVPSQSVHFTVVAGQGTLASAAALLTDSTGAVTAPVWTLGRTNIPQTLQATAGPAGAAIGTVSATIATHFTITLQYLGPPPDATIQAAFATAIARLTALVTTALTPVPLRNVDVDALCGTTGVSARSDTVTNVLIFASIGPIDGPGNILGQAGPCAVRSASKLPALGYMEFDVADLQLMAANGTLPDVVTHEMLHVLGFGSIWDAGLLNLIVNPGTSNPGYTGLAAIAACRTIPGVTTNQCTPTIPVEGGLGTGSNDSHWRETVFGRELMTPVSNAPPNPLSVMTIGALLDLGYVVNPLVADPFTLPSGLLGDLGNRSGLRASTTPATQPVIVRRPTWALDATGRAVPLARTAP